VLCSNRIIVSNFETVTSTHRYNHLPTISGGGCCCGGDVMTTGTCWAAMTSRMTSSQPLPGDGGSAAADWLLPAVTRGL